MSWRPSLLPPPLRVVARINGNFLLAAGAGVLAWACWPSGPGSWQAALISGFLAVLAATALARALALIVKIYSRERELAALLASGRAQHPADLADAIDLRRAGMTDD